MAPDELQQKTVDPLVGATEITIPENELQRKVISLTMVAPAESPDYGKKNRYSILGWRQKPDGITLTVFTEPDQIFHMHPTKALRNADGQFLLQFSTGSVYVMTIEGEYTLNEQGESESVIPQQQWTFRDRFLWAISGGKWGKW